MNATAVSHVRVISVNVTVAAPSPRAKNCASMTATTIEYTAAATPARARGDVSAIRSIIKVAVMVVSLWLESDRLAVSAQLHRGREAHRGEQESEPQTRTDEELQGVEL